MSRNECDRELHRELEQRPHTAAPGEQGVLETHTCSADRKRQDQDRDDHADHPRVGNPAFREARKRNGLVVNISSVAATTGIGSNVAYCASKAALNAMTVSLARALAPAIRVVSVSPGVVETGFISGLDQGWRDEQVERTPMGRFASPDEVGAAVLAMATTLAYSTGCIIPVDGGRPLW